MRIDTEKLLISRCVGGEAGAFDSLVEEYSPIVSSTIVNALRRYGFPVSKADVEDLHNGLFLAVMENNFWRLRSFQGRSALSSYLKVITVRYVVDFLRRQKKFVPLDSEFSGPHLTDPGAIPDRVIELSQEEATVRSIIVDLPSRERLFLKLVYDRELAPGQVCQILDISMTAYYNRKSRLLKKMKKLCEESSFAASQ